MQSLSANPSTFLGDDLPVETVSADQAKEFCERLSTATGHRIRLPSEAEWEYACRAGTNTAFHFGGPTVRSDLANYNGAGGAVGLTDRDRDVHIDTQTYNDVTYTSGAYAGDRSASSGASTMSVRSFPPNRFGLYEMHGNVWEHCGDTGPPVDYRELPADGRCVYRAAAGPHPARRIVGRTIPQSAARPTGTAWRPTTEVGRGASACASCASSTRRARREPVPLSPARSAAEGRPDPRCPSSSSHHHRRHQARSARRRWGIESLRARSCNHLGQAAGKLVTLLTDRRT